MLLPTDAANKAEYCALSVRRAADTFRSRIKDRLPRAVAYAEALAYLRRKTEWSAPLAAAALDEELAQVPVIR